MLEKLGLPPKPSARGRSWVIDASHCQQCASQFTIFNRKHHCRRCGGLFCGNCVQSRMMLRGQGDSPVRICEPCKQLELASKFEARHGRKKKDEASLEHEELLLKSLLNEESPGTPSSSIEPVTPESLRQKSRAEKEKSAALRKEGKTEEATKAYKKSKELERQADALALALRKSSKSKKPDASTPRSTSKNEPESTTPPPQTPPKASTEKKKPSITGDDDLLKELKDLGWSEGDLNQKQASDAEILRGKGGERKSGRVEALRMEILGHKRRALALKREGKLAEAKEELKLAKTLERRVEELETLGESDEEDGEEDGDELAAVLRALEKEIDQPGKKPVELNPESLRVIRDDLDDDDQMDVSESDLSDPEMLAALKAMGWSEEPRGPESFTTPRSKEELQAEILSHKRKALALKRAGNLVEARRELGEAKALERTLEAKEPEVSIEEPENIEVSESDMRDPEMLAALRALGFGGDGDDRELVAKVSSQEKRLLQREAGEVKLASEAALSRGNEAGLIYRDQQVKLKFDSRVRTRASLSDDDEEEEDVMSFVKDLSADPEVAAMLKGLSLDEKGREAPEVAPAPAPTPTLATGGRKVAAPVELPKRSKREIQQELLGKKRLAFSLRREGKEEESKKVLKEANVLEMQLKALEEAESKPQRLVIEQDDGDDEEDEQENDEVTESDMLDPSLLAALSALGFKEEAGAPVQQASGALKGVEKPLKSPVDEDDDAGFEGEYGEIGQVVDFVPSFFSRFTGSSSAENSKQKVEAPTPVSKQQEAQVPISKQQVQYPAPAPKQVQAQVPAPTSKQQQVQVQVQVQVPQAPAPLKQQVQTPQVHLPEQVSKAQQAPQAPRVQAPDVLPSKQPEPVLKQELQQPRDGKLRTASISSSLSVEQQVLEHKRNALRLKKAGDLAGAREELRQAKLLEKSQQEPSNTPTTTSTTTTTSTETKLLVKEEQKVAKVEQKKAESSFKDRMKLQRESLAHKRRALALRREGKAEEAEAEFELAKALEKQMEELDGAQVSGEGASVEGVEDVMDSQLAAALAGLGFQLPSSSSQPTTQAQPTRRAPEPKISQAQAAPAQLQQPESSSSVQEKIKSLKLRALELKRAGKQQEALQALREAKRIEKES